MEDKEEIEGVEGVDYTLRQSRGYRIIIRKKTSHPLKPGMPLEFMPKRIFTREDFPELHRRACTVKFNILNHDQFEDAPEKVQNPLAERSWIFVDSIDRFLEGKEQVTLSEIAKAYVAGINEMIHPFIEKNKDQGKAGKWRCALAEDLLLGMAGSRFFRNGWYLDTPEEPLKKEGK